jgi:hypothetical protein
VIRVLAPGLLASTLRTRRPARTRWLRAGLERFCRMPPVMIHKTRCLLLFQTAGRAATRRRAG